MSNKLNQIIGKSQPFKDERLSHHPIGKWYLKLPDQVKDISVVPVWE